MNVNPPAATPVVLPFTHPRATDPVNPAPRRLPGVAWIGDTSRNHVVAMIGEFTGTFLFLFMAFTGTQVANMYANNLKLDVTNLDGPNPSVLLYISLCFGFSLAVNAWVFFRISGGLFNPAVSPPHLVANIASGIQ
jgi:aquaporin related protein